MKGKGSKGRRKLVEAFSLTAQVLDVLIARMELQDIHLEQLERRLARLEQCLAQRKTGTYRDDSLERK